MLHSVKSNFARSVIIAAAALACGGAQAQRTASSFMPAGDVADPPEGFVEMCARDTALCAAEPAAAATRVRSAGSPFDDVGGATRSVDPARFRLAAFAPDAGISPAEPARVVDPVPAAADIGGAAGIELLRRINSKVNRTVVQVPDTVTAGVDEYWQRPTPGSILMGDCEDIAIEKRMRLIEAGFPPDRLFYAVAYVRGYGLHTMLVARLDAGDYVLDSLSPHLLAWSRIHYTWLRQQVPGNPLLWRRIGRPFRGDALVKAVAPNAGGAS